MATTFPVRVALDGALSVTLTVMPMKVSAMMGKGGAVVVGSRNGERSTVGRGRCAVVARSVVWPPSGLANALLGASFARQFVEDVCVDVDDLDAAKQAEVGLLSELEEVGVGHGAKLFGERDAVEEARVSGVRTQSTEITHLFSEMLLRSMLARLTDRTAS